MTLYRIKPLQWRKATRWPQTRLYQAGTVFGDIEVQCDESLRWSWGYCFHEGYDEAEQDCESADAGKAAAEAYYLSRLMPALEAVPAGQPGETGT